MKNWSDIAAASGLGIPADQAQRIAAPLDALEAAFRPLARGLSFADEPAAVFDPSENEA